MTEDELCRSSTIVTADHESSLATCEHYVYSSSIRYSVKDTCIYKHDANRVFGPKDLEARPETSIKLTALGPKVIRYLTNL